MTKYLYYTFTLILFSILGCESSNAGKQDISPNIILIMADDLGFSDVSAYRKYFGIADGSQSLTPNIDA